MSEREDTPTAHSTGDRIIAKANGGVVEGDWQTMERLATAILGEADDHKTDLERVAEISGAHVRLSCDCCGYDYEFERVRELRERGETPEEHVDHPDFECTRADVTVEAFCPRHGTIPLGYDECDGCADARNVMNR
jgi:hypothetical protein